MERLLPSRTFRFNTEIENWRSITEKALEDAYGTLYLIDKDTGEHIEAAILFLYSTLIYTGYNCRGILRIGDEIGTAFVSFTLNVESVLFRADDDLNNKDGFDEKAREIIEDLDDDCLYSEARHVRHNYCMNTMVRQYHATQRRNNDPDIPYTEHLFGVASILESVAGIYNEIDGPTLRDMKNAALGHDLLEDTLAGERMILAASNSKTLELIKELTNPNDDAHTDEYMEQIRNAGEEARLVKYADLIENTSSFCYCLHESHIDAPVTRAKEFYLPILRRTTEVLAATSFELYPKTAEAMKMTLKIYTDLLLSRIDLLEA